MAPESHPIMLLERIRNCRYYWQLNYFEQSRSYLTYLHSPPDSTPSKPLRPLCLAALFAFTRTAFTAFTFFVSHDFLLWWFIIIIHSLTNIYKKCYSPSSRSLSLRSIFLTLRSRRSASKSAFKDIFWSTLSTLALSSFNSASSFTLAA